MKETRYRVRTRPIEVQCRDSGGDTVELRINGRWLGFPRWYVESHYQRDNHEEQEAKQHD